MNLTTHCIFGESFLLANKQFVLDVVFALVMADQST